MVHIIFISSLHHLCMAHTDICSRQRWFTSSLICVSIYSITLFSIYSITLFYTVVVSYSFTLFYTVDVSYSIILITVCAVVFLYSLYCSAMAEGLKDTQYICTLNDELVKKAELELNEKPEWRERDIQALRDMILKKHSKCNFVNIIK